MRLLATAPRSIHVVEGGERTQGDDLRLEFLQAEGNDEPNASSLMTVVEIGGFRFLSTGDAERATEFALIDELPRGVDLLKVPHHGSKTSSSATFLEGVQPVVAVVSASGRYGLPDPTVRRRLDHFTELTLVTGESGAVVVRIFDDTFTLEDAGVD
jgi:competence protein ComEC